MTQIIQADRDALIERLRKGITSNNNRSVVEACRTMREAADALASTSTLSTPGLQTKLRETGALLAGWGESDFANAAAGEFGEDLLNRLTGLCLNAADALASLSPSPAEASEKGEVERIRAEAFEEAARVADRFVLDTSDSQLDDRDLDKLHGGALVAQTEIADAIRSLASLPLGTGRMMK